MTTTSNSRAIFGGTRVDNLGVIGSTGWASHAAKGTRKAHQTSSSSGPSTYGTTVDLREDDLLTDPNRTAAVGSNESVDVRGQVAARMHRLGNGPQRLARLDKVRCLHR